MMTGITGQAAFWQPGSQVRKACRNLGPRNSDVRLSNDQRWGSKVRRKARARFLGGGEQRMVTLARGLLSGAELPLLDDPFQWLAEPEEH